MPNYINDPKEIEKMFPKPVKAPEGAFTVPKGTFGVQSGTFGVPKGTFGVPEGTFTPPPMPPGPGEMKNLAMPPMTPGLSGLNTPPDNTTGKFWDVLKRGVNALTSINPAANPMPTSSPARDALMRQTAANPQSQYRYGPFLSDQRSVGGAGTIPTEAGDVKKAVTPPAAASERPTLEQLNRMPQEQFNKRFEAIPSENQPIHEIRGMTEAYWDPSTKMRYGTLPEAMSGQFAEPSPREKLDILSRQAIELERLKQAGLINEATIKAIAEVQKQSLANQGKTKWSHAYEGVNPVFYNEATAEVKRVTPEAGKKEKGQVPPSDPGQEQAARDRDRMSAWLIQNLPKPVLDELTSKADQKTRERMKEIIKSFSEK